MTVNYGFGGTAAGTEYTESASSVVIPAGNLSSNITLTGVNDSIPEEDATIIIRIDSLVNATSGSPDSVTATLSSDDPEVTNNGGATGVGQTAATLHGLLTMGDSASARIYWGTTDGGTIAANWGVTGVVGNVSEDTPFSTNLTALLAGQAYFYRCYVTNGSSLAEDWANASAAFTTEVASVSIRDIKIAEGGSGTTDAVFTVALSATSGVAAAVDFATADGTAAAGSDYTATNGTLVIPAGQINGQIVVKITGDTEFEHPSQTYTLNLSSPSNCTLAVSQATCTIQDDDAGEYLEDWWYRVRIDFDGYAGSETLTNWPALVRLSTNITGFSYSNFASDVGGDLRFANLDATRVLNFEIEEWDTNDESCVWVQLPELPPGGTSIWAYWRNPGETSLPAYASDGSVWSANYAGVWHLHEEVADESTGGTHEDSTANDNHGSQNNNDEVPGQIARGQQFDGGGDYVDCGNDASLSLNHLSVSAWVKTSTVGTWFRTIVSKYGYSGVTPSWGLGWNTGNALCFYVRDSGGGSVLVQGAGGWGTDDQWHHLVGTRGDGKVRFYGDGELLQELDDTISDIRNTRPVLMARHSGTYVNESLDEVRISSAARSGDWIAANYSNQVDGSTFVSFGEAEWLALPTIAIPTGVKNLTGNDADLAATVMSTGKAPTYVWAYWGRTNEGSNASAWAENDSLGLMVDVPPREVIAHASGLLSTTQYYYAYQASNSFGESWAFTNFTTLEAPAVNNGPGAVVDLGTATLNGNLTAGTLADVYVCWGATPGGTDTGNWERVESLGELGLGAFSTDVTAYHGLTYYYRCYVTNAVGYGWSPAASSFMTPAPALAVTSSYARIDIGPSGQRVDAGDGWQILPGAANANQNGPERSGAVMTSDPGDTFTISTADTAIGGADVGAIDWRDRGDSAADPVLGRVGEDFVKNNSGIVRVTLGSIPAGDYNVISYHVDPGNTQSGQIDVRASTDGGASFSGVLDSGTANFAYGGVNGANFTTLNISNSAATFSFTANGSDDVVIVFDGRPHGDDETPVNGLAIDSVESYPLAIENEAVTDPSTNSAVMNGTLMAYRQAFDIYAFWGTNSGGDVAGDWDASALVGRVENETPANLQYTVSGLDEETEYFCTFMATNDVTNVWASPVESFTTAGTLLVSNMPPSGVTTTTATLRGRVSKGGVAEAAIYWGTTDGGEVASAWANTSLSGTVNTPADLTTNVAVLANETYYYRAYATNAAGEDWADNLASFTTPLPTLSIDDVKVTEGDSGTTVAAFTVTLSAASGADASVLFTADGDTATTGTDYAVTNGTLVIPAGQVTRQIAVVVNGDNVGEWPSESFRVNLSGAVGCTIADAQGVGTITDDDLPEFIDSFGYKLRITFTNYTRPGVLTNFPALVKLDESIDRFSYYTFRSDSADDLRFSDEAGTQILNHEIEEWDVSGTSHVWVQVPAFSSNCTIWAYWGQAGLRTPASTSDGTTWSDDFLSVWHLDQDGGAEDLRDSTANGHDLADNGTDNASAAVSFGQDFQGGTDHLIDDDGEDYLNGLTAFTISMWIKSDVTHVDNCIFAGRGNDDDYLGIRYDLSGASGGGTPDVFKMGFRTTTKGKTQWETAASLQSTDWQHIAFRWGSGTTPIFYLNGSAVAYSYNGGTIGGAITGCDKLQLGKGNKPNWDGLMDEVRVSNVPRSADWIWASYMNQRPGGPSFATYSEVISEPTVFILW